MAAIARVRASLRVFGDSLEPDEVSALLGRPPSRQHRKGDKLEGGGDGVEHGGGREGGGEKGDGDGDHGSIGDGGGGAGGGTRGGCSGGG